MCTCVNEHYANPVVQHKRTSHFLFRCLVQNVCDSAINYLSRSSQGTEAIRNLCWKTRPLWPHLSPLTHSLSVMKTSIRRGWEGDDHFNSQNRFPQSQILSSFEDTFHSSFLLFLLFTVRLLPPGEEGSSALETLRVGLTVGSLGCSGCFNNYRGHLDELQGRFPILQGLAQVQDLRRKYNKILTVDLCSAIRHTDTFSSVTQHHQQVTLN